MIDWTVIFTQVYFPMKSKHGWMLRRICPATPGKASGLLKSACFFPSFTNTASLTKCGKLFKFFQLEPAPDGKKLQGNELWIMYLFSTCIESFGIHGWHPWHFHLGNQSKSLGCRPDSCRPCHPTAILEIKQWRGNGGASCLLILARGSPIQVTS